METILPAAELCSRLRIAAPLSFGQYHFAPAMAEMATRRPGARKARRAGLEELGAFEVTGPAIRGIGRSTDIFSNSWRRLLKAQRLAIASSARQAFEKSRSGSRSSAWLMSAKVERSSFGKK